jgi:N-acetylmuramic acid 6-phosphate etherase
MNDKSTEFIDPDLIDFDLRSNDEILSVLVENQQQAALAVSKAKPDLDKAIERAAEKLMTYDSGRLVLVGAGASGRIAVQDGAELWPTFGWPAQRLLCCMAGGEKALVHSIEGVEDDAVAAQQQVIQLAIGEQDVVLAIAASGRSAWTCSWLQQACETGALGIGLANNSDTPLLRLAHCPVLLETGSEVLAGSTRMTAGTAQKIALNLFSTTLMIRLNRTYGNLMVDMAAVNSKLDQRRIRLLQGVLPQLSEDDAASALNRADGWVKLAALIASGDSPGQAKKRLTRHAGSLRASLNELD